MRVDPASIASTIRFVALRRRAPRRRLSSVGPVHLAVDAGRARSPGAAQRDRSAAPLAAQSSRSRGLVFHVARRTARVIDISYGGIRFELPPAESIPAKFRMAIPGFEGVFRAKPVWSHYTPVGSISCGAELLEANPQTVARWRELVDAIHAGA